VRHTRCINFTPHLAPFCNNAFEQLTEIDRQRLHFGEQEKIVALGRTFDKVEAGIWTTPEDLTEVLFEGTV
jgi:restriction system protein